MVCLLGTSYMYVHCSANSGNIHLGACNREPFGGRYH